MISFLCVILKVTVTKPVCQEHGDLELALYGSFLPVPSTELFEKVGNKNII